MEDNIQTIVVVIISVFLLFIFPVYMAYEKKDDISYALAMRYTQDLVDEVRSKGYITKNMYEDYRAKLKVTGNAYDIKMTHEYNRYDPITNYYKIEDEQYTLVKTTTQEERQAFEEEAIQAAMDIGELTSASLDADVEKYITDLYASQDINKIENTYKISKQTYTTDHIVNILNSERKLLLNSGSETVICDDSDESNDGCQYAYTMNVDDNFNVTIKNTNITLATVIYNMVTANTLDENTRIYVNYGGAILSSKWYGDIDYAKMKHDDLTLDKLEKEVIFAEERRFVEANGNANPIENIVPNIDDEYSISFDVKPRQTTELREKGKVLVANYSGYNFALGNNTSLNENNMLSISVGINGISLITNTSVNLKAVDNGVFNLPYYSQAIEKTRIVQEEYTYIDEETGEEKTGVRDKEEKYFDWIEVQRSITEYNKLTLSYTEKGRIRVELANSRAGFSNTTGEIIVSDDNDLLAVLKEQNIVIENPSVGVVTRLLGQVANRGTNVSCSVSITDRTIGISADKYISEETTILSYPVAISNYTNVKVEVKANETGKYIALLYINGEKVDESIEMDIIPKVNVVGMTHIGDEQRYFEGYIKNVELYK